jgi:hypothetical protein
VTDSRVDARGRSWPLREILRVSVARQPPRLVPLLASLAVGVVLGLPLLHVALAGAVTPRTGYYEAALGVVSLIIFGSIGGLVFAEETYWLVLRTEQGEHRVFSSREHQRVIRLASVVAEALARQRR